MIVGDRMKEMRFKIWQGAVILGAAAVLLFLQSDVVDLGLRPTTQIITGEYCSIANGCPSDKCRLVTQCASGGNDSGCAPGETTCEYKDANLKADYTEFTVSQAGECAQDFVAQNAAAYPTLEYFEIDEANSGGESNSCSSNIRSKSNSEDTYCWFIKFRSTVEDLPFAPQFYVGAQTCNVYWDLPDRFKTDLSSLLGVKYSPDDAIGCAEEYIDANKTKYLEYADFVPNSLHVPNKQAHTHAKVTESTEDVLFYTVTGSGVYLVVGAHSCKVYGVNEQYYTAL